MSAASDLIAEVKASLAKATVALRSFEGENGEIGIFTDLAHLNIAAIHLREFVSSLEHQSNQPEPEPTIEAEAEAVPEGTQSPAAPAPEPPTEPEPVVDDPAAGLIAAPEAPAA